MLWRVTSLRASQPRATAPPASSPTAPPATPAGAGEGQGAGCCRRCCCWTGRDVYGAAACMPPSVGHPQSRCHPPRCSPAGTWSTALRTFACNECPAGTFGTQTGATDPTTCVKCPQGQYAPSSGARLLAARRLAWQRPLLADFKGHCAPLPPACPAAQQALSATCTPLPPSRLHPVPAVPRRDLQPLRGRSRLHQLPCWHLWHCGR